MKQQKKSFKIEICLFVLLAGLVCSESSFAKTKTKVAPKKAKAVVAPVVRKAPMVNSANQQLVVALNQVQKGQYAQAIPALFQMSRRPEFQAERDQIKFILGSALLEMDLSQIAAFQFVEVIKGGNKRYLKQAIEKLSQAADRLGDDTLLNYAVGKVNVDSFPASQRDMINFRLGEVKSRAGAFAEAANHFARVSPNSRYFFQAKYNRALNLAELNRAQDAAKEFRELINMRSRQAITDPIKVTAQLGLARSLYQAQDWDASVEAYREIPRDSEQWHQALFESTWALLRSAKYRSALSQFHSLHSSFYEDSYNPESLLLRGITYLYICKFEETQKVVDLFSTIYGPVAAQVNRAIESMDAMALSKEMEAAEKFRSSTQGKYAGRLPWPVARHLIAEGDVRRSLDYLENLSDEQGRLDASAISRTNVAKYGRRVLANRFKNAHLGMGEKAKVHLLNIRTELKDLKEQISFLELETSTGKAEILKKRISGKSLPGTIDDNVDRTFYVQNGYEYWPFSGEYWIDEIGNYHYLGKSSCQ